MSDSSPSTEHMAMQVMPAPLANGGHGAAAAAALEARPTAACTPTVKRSNAWKVRYATKVRWLPIPTQLPSHQQWWSSRRTHRPQSWQCLARGTCCALQCVHGGRSSSGLRARRTTSSRPV